MPRLLLVLCLLPLSLAAKVTRYDMRDVGGRNVIEFICDAPLEKTIGLSTFLSGWLELDPDHLAAGVKGAFTTDLRTFQTGIELRNELFREKWIGAAEFPEASFQVNRMLMTSASKLTEGEPVELRVDGLFKLRGISHPQAILIKLVSYRDSVLTRTRLPGNLLKVSASFDVDSAQYGVTIPDNLKARFTRFVQVSLDLVGSDGTTALLPAP